MADIEEDNIYPRSAEWFLKEPTVQAEERANEKDQVLSNAPQLRDTIARLNKSADFYESVNAIDDSVLTKPEEFMHVVAANKLAADILRKEAVRLSSVVEEFTED